jgi:hypothetical protein
LVDRGLTRCDELSESLIDSFLDVSLENVRTTASSYSPRANARGCLKSLFLYLVEIKALVPLKPKTVKKPYSWILDPYLRHLRSECELSEVTVQRMQVSWLGPYSWPGFEEINGLSGLPAFSGVYLLTVEYLSGNLIYAAGLTRRRFRDRFKEHTGKYLAGNTPF